MKKYLHHVATNEGLQLHSSLIESICEKSAGDLRSAVNTLQLVASHAPSNAVSTLIYYLPTPVRSSTRWIV